MEFGPAKIKVFGVGGGGGNALEYMIKAKLSGVSFACANTDVQALTKSGAEFKLQLGEKLTKGLGAGANPQVGREAALESIASIKESIGDTDMVFITAGMGGGTGTGAAPIIAQTAREMGVLTVGVVTKPFNFEGRRRIDLAEKGIEEFRKNVDSLIIIPNERLIMFAPKKASLLEMYGKANEVLHYAVKGISDLIMVSGLINLDFADVRSVMSESGLAMMGFGEASGESRARDAAVRAISSPFLEDVTIDGAKALLLNITAGPDLGIEEVNEAANIITEAAHPDANIFFGHVVDDTIGDAMHITVIATGLDSAANKKAEQAMQIQQTTVTQFEQPRVQPIAAAPRPRAMNQPAMVKEVMPRTRAPQAAMLSEEELAKPTYLRRGMGLLMPTRATVHTPGAETPVYNEDEYELPSFIVRQAD